ncbi:MAG: DNA-3-methyladenine glycosylase I [Gammaproteobacteria bacterium]|nr:DNA-3-methyladenine glycosylase I [Gammaproteobacteria bacterium]MCH9743565.1 DNA-3-methyladenine glycosylase I [Gammaproteobacteria bacterium]
MAAKKSYQAKKRCAWVSDDPLYIDYHDNEWGQPVYDEWQLFEFLNLEGMQAGLSWITILKKRDNYRKLFDGFNAEKIARYTPRKVETLLKNPGIIRNRLKVNAIISNAKVYLQYREQHGSFSEYLWDFVDGEPIINHWKTLKQVPASTDISDQMAKSLKKLGFKFVGSTICYAFMQAVGMVNDHTTDCYKNLNHT